MLNGSKNADVNPAPTRGQLELIFLLNERLLQGCLETGHHVLLVNQLDFFKQNGETHLGKSVQVFEENPHLRHGDAIQKLSQRGQVAVLTATDDFVGERTKRGQLCKHIGPVLVLRHALHHHGTLLPQRTRNEEEVAFGER